MNYTIGDGIVACAIAATIVGCLHITRSARHKKLEIIHQERMAAMEKGIPLPEFPLDPAPDPRPDPHPVLPILGTVLATLASGLMVVIFVNRSPESPGFWLAPLPFVFLGFGLIAIHFLTADPHR